MALTVGRVDELDFRPPGPGSWERERSHMPRMLTRHAAAVLPDAFWAGFSEAAREYGLLIEGVRMEPVNGYVFGQTRPAPPEQIPARIERAAEIWETRPWRRDVQRWDDEAKPAALERHRRLVAVEPSDLDDRQLIAYVRACADHHAAMITQHHRFNGACLLPLGDFIAHALSWGVARSELPGMFAGLSPASAGECPELAAAVAAIEGDAGARALVEDVDLEPGLVVQQLGAAEGPVGDSVRAWVALAGNRLVDGFDICSPTALEQPGHLVEVLRRALTHPTPPGAQAAVAAARARVPVEHRAEFDELYEEVRLTFRLRDERALYSDLPAAGVLRRSMLGVGRRLVERGLLDAPELAVEAYIDELAGLLHDGTGPTAAELAARAAARESDAGVPEHLGDPPAPPPPLDLLPPGAARTMAAMMAALSQAFGPDGSEADGVVRGIAACPGVHAGPVRLVRSPADLDGIRPGDVLVATCTSSAFNIAIAEAGAVVTDQGGILSHAAITAREFGIPAVVGTVHATTRLADGTAVRVDGSAGQVTIL